MSNKHESLLKGPIPCREFVEYVRTGEYKYLFDDFGAQIIGINDYATSIGNSCELVLHVRNMQLLFNSNPRDGDPNGTPQYVSVTGVLTGERGWYQLLQLLNFVEARQSMYIGPDSSKLPLGFETAHDRRCTLEKLIDFFATGEYERRKEEFDQWRIEDDQQFMKQVQKYYAG